MHGKSMDWFPCDGEKLVVNWSLRVKNYLRRMKLFLKTLILKTFESVH